MSRRAGPRNDASRPARGEGTTDAVLVLNAGSSSLKFSVYVRAPGAEWRESAGGQVEGIGARPRFVAHEHATTAPQVRDLSRAAPDHRAALDILLDWLRARAPRERLLGVGHRVVHGGDAFAAPVLVGPAVVAQLRELVPLAPLHQPHNLAAIEAVGERLPDVPQVACFDTGFHRDLPPLARLVPVPAEIRARGVRRYGFHGLSYEYIAGALPAVAPSIAGGRVIVAHLGNGASLCALRDGRSVECSFGFTALDGLCMGTRPGALDPGVVLYLAQEAGLTAAEIEALLYRRSGLLGISGIASDMRALLASETPEARLAVDYFVYRAAQQVGAFAAVLGGLDALVFTAGIGENSPVIRARICRASAWLGITLDEAANERHGPRITSEASPVSAWVVPTDEELTIARHTSRLLGLEGASGSDDRPRHRTRPGS